MLIVQKYGGSSVADEKCIARVAERIVHTAREGHKLVVVVSAQGDTTDDLKAKARLTHPEPSRREEDMLLVTGEQQSAALVAMAIQRLGLPACSLGAWQVGIHATSVYGNARIHRIETERMHTELDRGNIVVVAGFQGINKYGDFTTLGRGASDTTAAAIAAVLNADLCEIYSDVPGVYTADPRIVANARKIDKIGYDEMLELASLGVQILHNRSVEMAKRYKVKLVVRSSMSHEEGTLVEEAGLEKLLVSGVALDEDVACIAVVGLADKPGIAFKIFSLLAKSGITVDIILQSIGRDNTKDISFTVNRDNLAAALSILEANREAIAFSALKPNDDVTKLSIVGAGMASNPGVAAKMFEALYDAGINIAMISTSEIKISVLIAKDAGKRAMNVLHDKFFA